MAVDNSEQKVLRSGDKSIAPTSRDLMPERFDYANFGQEFLVYYLARGFGSLTKRELELQIFKQLSEAGAFQNSSSSWMQQTSVLLRIPISRVRSLTYEMQLRGGIVTTEWFREQLLAAIRTTKYKKTTERIEFGVEDPMLRAEIEGRLKLEGRFPDYGMSREILHLSVEDFSYLLEQILSADERQAILDGIPKSNSSIVEENQFSKAIRIFINAAAEGAGDEFGRGGVKILFSFLTCGIGPITASIHNLFQLKLNN